MTTTSLVTRSIKRLLPWPLPRSLQRSLPLALVVSAAVASLSEPLWAQERNGFQGLPSLVCVDRRTASLCEDQRRSGASKLEALRAAMPDSPFLPVIACEIPGAPGPCSVSVCGDRVCAFGERGQCQLDCPVPAKVDICNCEPGGCQAFRLTCDAYGCTSATVTANADICKCIGPDGSGICTAEADKLCRMMRFDQPVRGCELVRYHTGERRAYARCSHESCPPASFGLTEAEDLPLVERVEVEGPK